jgi:hypothetical protein
LPAAGPDGTREAQIVVVVYGRMPGRMPTPAASRRRRAAVGDAAGLSGRDLSAILRRRLPVAARAVAGPALTTPGAPRSRPMPGTDGHGSTQLWKNS